MPLFVMTWLSWHHTEKCNQTEPASSVPVTPSKWRWPEIETCTGRGLMTYSILYILAISLTLFLYTVTSGL